MSTMQGEIRQGQGLQRAGVRKTAKGAGRKAAEKAPGVGGGNVRLCGKDGFQDQ